MNLEEFSQAVASEASEIQGVQFDPMLILAVISAIVTLIQNCRNPVTLETVKKPGLLQRWALKRAIKTTLDDPAMERQYLVGLYKACLNQSQNLTEESLGTIMVDVQLRSGLL